MYFTNVVTLASALLLGTVSHVSAHGFAKEWRTVETYPGFSPPRGKDQPESIGWYYNAPDTGFVSPTAYRNGDIICGKDASPGQKHGTVAAGSSITLRLNQWPKGHHGPILIYIANCNGECEKVDKYKLRWVKIFECGLLAPPKKWCSTQTLTGDDPVTEINIPKELAPGNWVVRYEIITLHQAFEKNGAQNYPFCANFEVTGSGSVNPPGVPATEFYSPDDPGIAFHMYDKNLKSYEIPGPDVFDFSQASNGSDASTPPKKADKTPPTADTGKPKGTANSTDKEEKTTPAPPKKADKTPPTADTGKPKATANSTDVEEETTPGASKSPESPKEKYPKIPEAEGAKDNSGAGNGNSKSKPDDGTSGGHNSTDGAGEAATPKETSPETPEAGSDSGSNGTGYGTPETTPPETPGAGGDSDSSGTGHETPETACPETPEAGADSGSSGTGYGTPETTSPETLETGGDSNGNGTGHGTPETTSSETPKARGDSNGTETGYGTPEDANTETPGAPSEDKVESFLKSLVEWVKTKVDGFLKDRQEGDRKHARHLVA